MSDIDKILKLQNEDVEALFKILELEIVAIATRNTSDIQQLAKKKIKLIQKIQQRDKSLAQNLTEKSPSDENLAQIEQIQNTLTQCHEQNETNGIALQRAALSIHKLRNLFQESLAKDGMTYDEEGKASGAKSLGTNLKA